MAQKVFNSLDLQGQKIIGLGAASGNGEAVRYEQVGALGFKATIDSASLIDNGIITEAKLATAVQNKLNANSAQNNTTATTNPSVNDDSADGYSVKSFWINTASSEVYMCIDATEGAAVWVKTTLTVDELGALALKNTIDSSSLIENGVVTLAKIENVAQYEILARSSSGSGAVEKLASSANVISLLGASNYSAMRTQLSLVPGTDVQTQNTNLQAISGVTSEADKLFYFNGSGTGTVTTFSSFGRSLVDDANASAARSTLGLVIDTDVQGYGARLADVSGLTPTDNGVIIGNGTNFVLESGSTLLTSIGAQPLDSQLTDIAGLTPSSDTFIVGDGTNYVSKTASEVRSIISAPGKYTADFNNTTDWAGSGPYTYTVSAGTHGLGSTKALIAQVKEDGSPNEVVGVKITIADNGAVVVTSDSAKFAGDIVILG